MLHGVTPNFLSTRKCQNVQELSDRLIIFTSGMTLAMLWVHLHCESLQSTASADAGLSAPPHPRASLCLPGCASRTESRTTFQSCREFASASGRQASGTKSGLLIPPNPSPPLPPHLPALPAWGSTPWDMPWGLVGRSYGLMGQRKVN